MAVILEENINIISFTFGILPNNWLKKLRERNVLLIGTATTVREAILLEKQGINIIIAQGSEAGSL